MQIACTNCQAKIKVPDSAAGKKGKCPKCGTMLIIPVAPPAEEMKAPQTGMMAEPPPARVDIEAEAADADYNPPVPKRPPTTAERDDYEDEADRDDERRSRRGRDEDDLDDEQRRRSSGEMDILRRQPSIGLSLTSMILGIASILITLASTIGGGLFGLFCPCGFIGGYLGVGLSGILALVSLPLGFVGMNKGGKGFAITGLATSGISVVLILLYVVLSILGIGLFAMCMAANQPPPPR